MIYNNPNAGESFMDRRQTTAKREKRERTRRGLTNRRLSKTSGRPQTARRRPASASTTKKTYQRPQSARSRISSYDEKTSKRPLKRPQSARSTFSLASNSTYERPQSARSSIPMESIYSTTSSTLMKKKPYRSNHHGFMKETKASLFRRRASTPTLIPAAPGYRGRSTYIPRNRHDQVVSNANRTQYPLPNRVRPRSFYKTEPDFAPLSSDYKEGAGFVVNNRRRFSSPSDGIVVAVHAASSTPASKKSTQLGTAAQHYT
eukprot:CAMPEP_0117425084 /NCGR_PEP_ID=MMETSP0758-20121206/5398_1 /TAXON_ID=63605 /ORGANISM="Percolomonas cosmopolitus, Strain AE-1 (ATCC 50343)" /LENGTH=259 /DNA_ID=CAMNT_0005209299 /DNA_START=370 /DNA_END=1145 /DNA_ORIENTATION=+